MIPYIINAGLILTGCLAFYKIFLRKETFFRLNRTILLICLAIAFTLPLIPVPREWSLRNAEVKERNSSIIQPGPQWAEKSESSSTNYYPSTSNAETTSQATIVKPEATSPLSRQAELSASEPGLALSQIVKWTIWIYWFGVIVFAMNFLLQFGLLLWRAYSNPVIYDGKFRIVEVSGNQAPCSFMNNIFINPEKYDWTTYNQILQHEKVHVSEKHSIDILFAELMLIFQWFNPFAWVYRKEIENNLEFLTDNTVLQKGRLEICSYQMSLLRVSAAHLPLSLTTNYNQSLLKKRIAMMNAKKSNINTSWKYFFMIPMLALFACLLNEPVANAQTKNPANTKNTTATKNVQKTNTTNKTNSTNKTNTTNKTNNTQNSKDTETIVDIRVNQKTGKTDTIVKVIKKVDKQSSKNDDGDLKTEGYWFATIKGDKIRIQLTNSDKKDNNSYSGSEFTLSEFPSLPRVADADFKLTREAGTMNFNGKFEGDQGKGKYKFVGDKSYGDKVEQSLEEKLSEEDLLIFFLIDIKKSFVQMLNDEGYKKLEKDELISLAAMKVDRELISSLKANGFTNVDVEELISVKAMNIDGQYIKEIRDAGYTNITLEELVSFKAMGIDKNYINKVGKFHSNELVEPDDLISLKAMNIDENYASQFKGVGYDNISSEDLIAMKSVGVTPEYIKSFRSAGFTKASAEDYVSMKSVGVTPEYAKSFQGLGYKEIDPEELISLKSMGVTSTFVKSFNDIGFKNIPLDDIISVKATGVTPAYVKSMKAKGFSYTKLEKYITLKSLADGD